MTPNMNDPGLEGPLNEASKDVEDDAHKRFEEEEEEEEQNFLDPRFVVVPDPGYSH